MDYSLLMLEELGNLENLCDDCKGELRFLSKKIRNDIWNSSNKKYTRKLAIFLRTFNCTYKMIYDFTGYFDLSNIYEYVALLAKYGIFYAPQLDASYYNQLMDEIQIESARLVIKQQWQNVFAKEDGYKSFYEIFDDIFSQCINIRRDNFYHKLSKEDVLCRVVNNSGVINKNRFIPFDKSSSINRWTPPGETYLYLSFTQEDYKYNKNLKLSEYICLKEFRAKQGNKFYFCNFIPVTDGKILDLSFNDISLRAIKNRLEVYQNDLEQKMIEEVLNEPNALEKYKDKKKLKKRVGELNHKYEVDQAIIEENFANQYLKMICSCIYEKVDETDDTKKEMAYKSFWVLSKYLKEKGVTGIIYPCTRTNKIVGKNLVLFNKYDAEPIESTIREFDY